MRRSLRIVLVSVVTATVLASAIFAAVVRTYTVREEAERAFAMWNDEQLVVFVQGISIGTSATVMQQLISASASRAGIHAAASQPRVAARITVVRVEHGAVLPPTILPSTSRIELFLFHGASPRFVKGRPLVAGGFWNGSGIDRIETTDYLRLARAPGPDERGLWQSAIVIPPGGKALLQVRIGSDAFLLASARRGNDVTIDLVRDGAASMRLFEQRATMRPVSQREYDSLFGVTEGR